jgi:hypothetical protein
MGERRRGEEERRRRREEEREESEEKKVRKVTEGHTGQPYFPVVDTVTLVEVTAGASLTCASGPVSVTGDQGHLRPLCPLVRSGSGEEWTALAVLIPSHTLVFLPPGLRSPWPWRPGDPRLSPW